MGGDLYFRPTRNDYIFIAVCATIRIVVTLKDIVLRAIITFRDYNELYKVADLYLVIHFYILTELLLLFLAENVAGGHITVEGSCLLVK